MLKTLSNKAILTKSRSMFGRRLTENDYNELLRKQSVPEVAAYLRDNTHYSEALGKIDVQTIRRGQLESILKRQIFETYIRLVKYDFAKDTDFFNYVVVRSEIDQILMSLRLINSNTSAEYYFKMPSYLMKHASFDIAALGEAHNFQQLLLAVQKTDYFKILDKFKPEEGQQINITACETSLLTYYFNRIFDTIDKQFKGKANKELKDLFTMQIDIYNFSVAYRLRRFFNTTPQETSSCLLPFSTPSKKVIEAIVQAESKEVIQEIVTKSKYGRDQHIDDMEYIESLAERLRFHLSMKDMRYSTNPSVVLASYMLLCTIECTNIINIVEGIRYGLDVADIKKLLTKEGWR